MEKFDIELNPNKKDLYRYYVVSRLKSINGVMLCIFAIVCSISLACNISNPDNTTVNVCFLTILFGTLFLQPYIITRKIVKKSRGIISTFSDEGISYGIPGKSKSTQELKWDKLINVLEYNDLLVLLFLFTKDNKSNKKGVFFFSRYAFTDERYISLKELLSHRKISFKNRIGFNIEAIKNKKSFLLLALSILLFSPMVYELWKPHKSLIIPPLILKAGAPYIDSMEASEIIPAKYDSVKPVYLTLNNKNRSFSDYCSYSIESMYLGKDGVVWLGSKGTGICKFDGQNLTYYSKIISDTAITCMTKDTAGKLWIGTKDRLICFTGKYFMTYTHLSSSHYKLGEIYCMTEDKAGNLWFSAGKGLYCYTGKQILNFQSSQGLCSNYITSIALDSTGNLWFGSGVGAAEEGADLEKTLDNISYSGDKTKTVNDFLNTITTLPDYKPSIETSQNVSDSGQPVARYSDGRALYGGVSRYNGKTFENYTMAQGLMGNMVLQMEAGENNTMWFYGLGFGKYDGTKFLCFDNGNLFYSYYLKTFFVDHTGRIWLCSLGGKTYVSEQNETQLKEFTKLNAIYINCINEDSKGNIWFGTSSGELIKYNGRDLIKYQVF